MVSYYLVSNYNPSDNKRVHFGENFKPTNWKKKLTKGDYKVIVELVHTNKVSANRK